MSVQPLNRKVRKVDSDTAMLFSHVEEAMEEAWRADQESFNVNVPEGTSEEKVAAVTSYYEEIGLLAVERYGNQLTFSIVSQTERK
jgi:broad specificity polyphosphatase/5'/3'-nucleotidase SurE